MIALENIEVTFNKGTPLEVSSLKKLNLVIHEGEFVTLIGGNGAGKSTLMNVISGEVTPDNGSVFINKQDVTKLHTTARAPLVSRVFQDPMKGTCATLTVEENLALAYMRLEKLSLKMALNKKRRDYFRERLAELGIGLEDRLEDPIGMLSGGQRQAISLVMATLQPCQVLLLDEHTAALDPKMAKVVMDVTQNLIQKYELTALMITHSMSQALAYGSRTLMLHRGVIERDMSGDERGGLKSGDLIKFFDLD